MGIDPESDLEILKVDLFAGITPLQLADSESPQVGSLELHFAAPSAWKAQSQRSFTHSGRLNLFLLR